MHHFISLDKRLVYFLSTDSPSFRDFRYLLSTYQHCTRTYDMAIVAVRDCC